MLHIMKCDLSEFSKDERISMAEKLLKSAPHTVDDATLNAKKEALLKALNIVKSCEHYLEELKTVTTDGVQVESLYRFAQTDFQKCCNDLKYYCEGNAWYGTIHGILDDGVSNSVINGFLANLLQVEMVSTHNIVVPAWYEKIVNAILDITGIDIRVSEFN